MTIAITGANGVTGRAVLAALGQRGARVRAIASRAESAASLREAGAHEAAVAPLQDVDALREAFRGAAAVFHIPPRMKPDEVDNGMRVIEAARAAGVRLVALHSVINSQVQSIRFHVHKRLVEEAAITSGLPWIVFQPTNYMQNVGWNWQRLVEKGELLFPYSAQALVSWVDLHDYAQAVARALTDPGWEWGTYEAVGTSEPLTRHALASIWSVALGREVRAATLPLDDYMALPQWAGRDPREMAILRTMFEEFDRHGSPGGNARVLGLLLGREPTAYEAFARRYARERAVTPGAETAMKFRERTIHGE